MIDPDRKDLDPERLADLLRALNTIYPEFDVTRPQVTTFNTRGALCSDEIRFNITIRNRR